jgi:hypothetical protein
VLLSLPVRGRATICSAAAARTLQFAAVPKPALTHVSRVLPFAVVFLALGLLAGCGDGNGDKPSNKNQSLRIEQFQADVRFFCTSGKDDLVGAADPLGTVITAVDQLIKIYREDPEATYKLAKIANTGDKLGIQEVPIRKLLEESATTLDDKCGSYGRDQARRLREAVQS